MNGSYAKQKQNAATPITIDFSPVTQYPSVLTISHWDSGITWTLAVNDSIEEFQYYDETVVALSFVAAQAECNDWYLSIPEEIRMPLSVYSYNDFAVLYLTSHYYQAYQLFVAHPTLFSLVLRVAKKEKLEETQLVELLSQPRIKLMQYCELPATKGAIKLLGKVRFKSFNRSVAGLIGDLFKVENHVCLNHREYINLRIIKILSKYPELVNTRFIHHFEADCVPRFSYLTTIDDTIRLSDRRGVDGIKRVGDCRNYNELVALHDRLATENSLQKTERMIGVNYPEPPIQGNEQIIPVTTWLGLFKEGVEQHHCVEIYHENVMAGQYYVYKVLSPERATLGLKIGRVGQPQVDQLLLSSNGKVSDETRLMVQCWLDENKQKKEAK